MGSSIGSATTEESQDVMSAFRGSFGVLKLFDIVHFAMMNRLTGLLKIENGETTGYLELNKGKLLSVRKGSAAHSDEAALEFFQWDRGKYEFRFVPVDSVSMILQSTESYLLEMAAMVDDLRNEVDVKAIAQGERNVNRSEFHSLMEKSPDEELRRLLDKAPCPPDASKGEDVSEFDRMLEQLVNRNGSVLYLKENNAPRLVRNGESFFLNYEPVSRETLEHCCKTVLGDEWDMNVGEDYRLESQYYSEGIGYFTVHIYCEFGTTTLAAQLIKTKIPDLADLNMPVQHLSACVLSEGLVIVAGRRRSGKSTTVASMLDFINRTQGWVIHTFEQTLEFKHQNALAVVNQMRVNFCNPDFASAIQYGLRQKPDVIFIDQLFNRRVAEIALDAARCGSLVLTTINAEDCAEAIEKIVNLYSKERQSSVMKSLSETCRGVIAQQLVSSKKGGFVPIVEFMAGIKEISTLIAAGDFNTLRRFLKDPPLPELISFDQSRATLREKGLIK